MFTKPNIQNKSRPPNKTVNNTRFYDNIALFYCGVSGVSSLSIILLALPITNISNDCPM